MPKDVHRHHLHGNNQSKGVNPKAKAKRVAATGRKGNARLVENRIVDSSKYLILATLVVGQPLLTR